VGSKPPKVDGFGVAERKAVHAAVRLVWQRCLARRLALKRATDAEGYFRCEQCGERTPKCHVDHREPVGEVGGPDYIARMFTPSVNLSVLCPPCHKPKTKRERVRVTRAGVPRAAASSDPPLPTARAPRA
jgi:Zn finger protein HypA/HybF involved in hydrogenase expression